MMINPKQGNFGHLILHDSKLSILRGSECRSVSTLLEDLMITACPMIRTLHRKNESRRCELWKENQRRPKFCQERWNKNHQNVIQAMMGKQRNFQRQRHTPFSQREPK